MLALRNASTVTVAMPRSCHASGRIARAASWVARYWGDRAAPPATAPGFALLSTPSSKPAPAGETATQLATAESLGWQLRGALPLLRLSSISLYDRAGDVLWLSEGALGPDEHGFVLDALAALGADPSLAHCDRDLQDGRAAAFLAIRSPQGELCGVAMVLVDSKASSPKGLSARALTPPVRAILQRVAVLLRPQPAGAIDAPAVRPVANPDTARRASSAAERRAPAHAVRVGPAVGASKAQAAGTPATRASGMGSAVAPASPNVPTIHAADSASIEWTPSTPSSSAPQDLTIPSADLAPKEVEQVLTLELLDEPAPASRPVNDRPQPEPRAATPAPQQPARTGQPNARPSQQMRGAAQVVRAPPQQVRAAPQPPAARAQQQMRTAGSQQSARASKQPAASLPPRPLATQTQGRVALYAQELGKLRPGGRTHRYQIVPVSLRSAQDSDAEERADQQAQAVIALCRELIGWLGANRALCERGPISFSISISAQALTVERLPQMLVAAMGLSQVSPACIGFEIQEAACIRQRANAEHLIRECENMGCFFVLDDFQFDSAALELLRSRALRLVKVDPKLVTLALSDKLAQARIVAIAQAARVLGIHCAAKNVNAENTKRWITAAGFDFADGALFGAPRPLDALIGAPDSGH